MASSYTTALGKIRSALVTAVNAVQAGLVTSSATTFPRVEIGDVTEMKVQDKGYDVRMLYCNIDVISQSYGTSINYAEQINTAVVGHKTLTVSGFSSIGAVVDNITEIIEPQEGSFTIYRIISRVEITVEPVEIPEVPEIPEEPEVPGDPEVPEEE